MRTPSEPEGTGPGAPALAAAWSLVAAGLREPGEETAAEVRDPALREAARESLAALGEGFPEAGERLLDALGRFTAQELRRERARVFGHSVRGPCPAYEIEYGPEHFLGKSHRMGDIGAFYRAFGVEVADDARERLDHIGVETEFLALLAWKRGLAEGRGEAERGAVCRDAERRFLQEHLGQFLPSLARRVAEREPGGALDAALALGARLAAVHAAAVGASLGHPDLELREIGTLEEETVVSCSPGAVPGVQGAAAAGGEEV